MTSPTLTLALLAGLPAGVALWTLLEYVLHRFAFHEAGGANYGSREHLRHHGSDDTVLESWYLSWAGVLLVSLALIPGIGAVLGIHQLGWGVGFGYLVGYGFYDWIHWRAHRKPIANRYEANVRRHHFIHHFHAPMQNHGVTTPFWDHVFGTYVEVERVQVPRRLAMRWLLDEEGQVRPEYRDTYELRGGLSLDERQRMIDAARALRNEAPAV